MSPDTLGVPPNCTLKFGYSPDGVTQFPLNTMIQGNCAIFFAKRLKNATSDGYLFVDVDGTDEKPIRAFSIRHPIPACILDQFRHHHRHLALK
jgi:hypothetical protein